MPAIVGILSSLVAGVGAYLAYRRGRHGDDALASVEMVKVAFGGVTSRAESLQVDLTAARADAAATRIELASTRLDLITARDELRAVSARLAAVQAELDASRRHVADLEHDRPKNVSA